MTTALSFLRPCELSRRAASTTTGTWGTGRPLVLLLLLPLLPQLAGSVLNIWYDAFHVWPLLDASQSRIGQQVNLLYILAVFPVGITVWILSLLRLHGPLIAHESGRPLPADAAALARDAAIGLAGRGLRLVGAGWLLSLPVLMVALSMGSTPVDPRVWLRLGTSMTLIGLMSITQSVLLVDLITARHLLPRLPEEPTGSIAGRPRRPFSLAARAWLWLFSVAVCPVLSLLVLLTTQDLGNEARLFAATVGSTGICFAVGSGWVMARLVLDPIDHLRRAARDVAAGRLETSIEPPCADELGLLVHEFNTMVGALRAQNALRRELAARTHALENTTRELECAGLAQQETTEHLRSALQAAQAAEQTRSDFLAGVSHECRTPLSAILGFAEMLLDGELEPAEAHELTQAIQRSGRHLLSLIDETLDLGGLHAGRIPFDVVAAPLPPLLARATEPAQQAARARGIDFHVDVAGDVPRQIETDPRRLEQALRALLDNAVKSTDAGSVRLRVRLAERSAQNHGRRLRFEIDDTGTGIAAGSIERIDEPLFPGEGSPPHPHGGAIFGLPIAHHLAGLLRGNLTARSRSGGGSRFTLTIDPGPSGD